MADTQSPRMTPRGDRIPPKSARDDITEKAVAVFVLVLGVVLGLVDQRSGADVGLRVPALIASLFLVANALNVVLPIGAKGHVEDDAEAEVLDPGRAVQRGQAPVPAAPPGKPSPIISVLLMGLAIWLGLATLWYQDAETQLTGLSLLAAFLIFSRGLAELPGR
ncbi:MAG: hypothetical protein ACKVZ6_17780 [Kineosporiaceae bacterium]|jgi:hypothetical protein